MLSILEKIKGIFGMEENNFQSFFFSFNFCLFIGKKFYKIFSTPSVLIYVTLFIF